MAGIRNLWRGVFFKKVSFNFSHLSSCRFVVFFLISTSTKGGGGKDIKGARIQNQSIWLFVSNSGRGSVKEEVETTY